MQKVKQFAFERKDLLIRAGGAVAAALILVLSLALTVFADTTYKIHDGGSQMIYKTDATEPEEVLEEAGSPPGSPVPGILQARTLEWVAISFSNA